MWILLRKKDAEKFLDNKNELGRLRNKVERLEDGWQTERIALSDIKEQVLNTIRRLEMRDKRSKQKASEPDNGSNESNALTDGMDPVSQRVFQKRTIRRPDAIREGVHR